jgi:hypothetical protein
MEDESASPEGSLVQMDDLAIKDWLKVPGFHRKVLPIKRILTVSNNFRPPPKGPAPCSSR